MGAKPVSRSDDWRQASIRTRTCAPGIRYTEATIKASLVHQGGRGRQASIQKRRWAPSQDPGVTRGAKPVFNGGDGRQASIQQALDAPRHSPEAAMGAKRVSMSNLGAKGVSRGDHGHQASIQQRD